MYILCEYFAIFIFAVRALITVKIHYCLIPLLVHKIQLTADKEMEACGKLGSIFAGTMYSTIWMALIREGFAMLVVCHELKTRRVN